jgi:hypothetical protein
MSARAEHFAAAVVTQAKQIAKAMKAYADEEVRPETRDIGMRQQIRMLERAFESFVARREQEKRERERAS